MQKIRRSIGCNIATNGRRKGRCRMWSELAKRKQSQQKKIGSGRGGLVSNPNYGKDLKSGKPWKQKWLSDTSRLWDRREKRFREDPFNCWTGCGMCQGGGAARPRQRRRAVLCMARCWLNSKFRERSKWRSCGPSPWHLQACSVLPHSFGQYEQC